MLLKNDIPNIDSETVNITTEDLTTDEELEIKKNYFPIVERKNLLQDSYFLYDQSSFVKKSFIMELNKFLSIHGSLTYFDEKK